MQAWGDDSGDRSMPMFFYVSKVVGMGNDVVSKTCCHYIAVTG